jgi:hypothetical protein
MGEIIKKYHVIIIGAAQKKRELEKMPVNLPRPPTVRNPPISRAKPDETPRENRIS